MTHRIPERLAWVATEGESEPVVYLLVLPDGDPRVLHGQLGYSGAFGETQVRVRSGRTERRDRIDPGAGKAFNDGGKGALVDGVVCERGKRKRAEAGEETHGRPQISRSAGSSSG